MEIPGYDELTKLDAGGFSTVYRAFQREFRRWVAIKVLDVGLDPRQRDAFERECHAMGLVSQHPNIVTVLSAVYTDDGRPAIVMELYGGGTYAQRMLREGPLPAADTLSLGVRIGAALHSAHERGLLHRDVKPQNLFVSDYGEPALGDFGISAFSGERTHDGALSTHYAAPEIITGQPAAPTSDVYALAATLYTLIAGRRPFARPGTKQRRSEVELRIREQPPPPIGGQCPASLERALLSGLEKRPEDRPVSAVAFARGLQRAQQELGLPPTELALARAADHTPLTVTTEQVHETPADDESSTVLRPVLTPVGDPQPPQPADTGAAASEATAAAPPPSPERSRRSLVVGGITAAVVLTGVALGVSGTIDDGDVALVENGTGAGVASIEDVAPPAALTPPEDVEVAPVADGVATVTWTPQEDVAYEVERVDIDTAQRWTSDDGEVVIDGLTAGERPCVVVRAISAAGQLSADTPPVCAAAD